MQALVLDYFIGRGRLYCTDDTWVNADHTKTGVRESTSAANSSQTRRSELAAGIKQPSGRGGRLRFTDCGNEEDFVDGTEVIIRARKEVEADTMDELVLLAYQCHRNGEGMSTSSWTSW